MTIYTLDSYDPEMIAQGIKQVGSIDALIAISVIQIALYSAIFGGLGIVLSNKTGLWKKCEKNSTAIKAVILTSIIGGLLISIFDRYTFGAFIEPVREFFEVKPSLAYIIGSFTYGGVFEELLMRLFFMSLLVWIIAKVLYKKDEAIPTKVYVFANIIAALLFAAGHLPSTKLLFGYLDGMILLRCFLLNGAFGLIFGWLYRKFGIQYAMLAHFGCHLSSKNISLLFI